MVVDQQVRRTVSCASLASGGRDARHGPSPHSQSACVSALVQLIHPFIQIYFLLLTFIRIFKFPLNKAQHGTASSSSGYASSRATARSQVFVAAHVYSNADCNAQVDCAVSPLLREIHDLPRVLHARQHGGGGPLCRCWQLCIRYDVTGGTKEISAHETEVIGKSERGGGAASSSSRMTTGTHTHTHTHTHTRTRLRGNALIAFVYAWTDAPAITMTRLCTPQ